VKDAALVANRVLSLGGALARNPFAVWAAFVLAHLWLGLLNLYGPGFPMGDVTSVYKFWVDQAVVTDFHVGIDSQWVYPIVAFVPMLIAFAFGGTLYASTWLSMIMVLDAVAFGMLTGWGRRREHISIGWWWVAFLFLLGPIALGRIDSVTIPLALIGVLLVARHPRAAALVLTVATWIKVWPAALIAAIVISVHERLRIIVVAIATSLVIIAVALSLGSGSNVFSFITQQTGRGLQIEAPISTVWLWMTEAGVPNAFVYYDQAILTFQVNGPGTNVVAALMTPLFALVVLAVCALGVLAVRRGATTTQLLPALALALVSAFMVFNKVGSPQFESWLAVPIVFGLVSWRMGGLSFRTPAIIVLIVAGLTQVVYPYLYNYLLSVDPVMLIAISARNLLLIVLFGWALAAVIRLAKAATTHVEVHESGATPTSWPLDHNRRDDALQEIQPS
jgi:hypothetical protein